MKEQNKKVLQKIVVGGIIMRDSKILILQRGRDEDVYPDMWELPSGKREPLEPSNISLTREIKEETGLDVKIAMPINVFDYQIEKPDEIRDSTQINFLTAPINNNDVILSGEHQNFAWITKQEINKYNLTESTKNAIKEGFNIIKKLRI